MWPGVWSASATAHTSATRRPNAAVPLYLSPKSLERHVAAVFDKLGLPPDSDDNRRVLAVIAFLRAPG